MKKKKIKYRSSYQVIHLNQSKSKIISHSTTKKNLFSLAILLRVYLDQHMNTITICNRPHCCCLKKCFAMIHIFEVYQTTAEQKLKLNKKEKPNNIKHVNCMLQGWSEMGLCGIWFDF